MWVPCGFTIRLLYIRSSPLATPLQITNSVDWFRLLWDLSLSASPSLYGFIAWYPRQTREVMVSPSS